MINYTLLSRNHDYINEPSKKRLANAVKAIGELIPDIISNCVVKNGEIFKEIYADKITKIIDECFFFKSELLDLYEWMGISNEYLSEGMYKNLAFNTFLDLFKIHDNSQFIIDKIVFDLNIMVDVENDIIEGEFTSYV